MKYSEVITLPNAPARHDVRGSEREKDDGDGEEESISHIDPTVAPRDLKRRSEIRKESVKAGAGANSAARMVA